MAILSVGIKLLMYTVFLNASPMPYMEIVFSKLLDKSMGLDRDFARNWE